MNSNPRYLFFGSNLDIKETDAIFAIKKIIKMSHCKRMFKGAHLFL